MKYAENKNFTICQIEMNTLVFFTKILRKGWKNTINRTFIYITQKK